MPEDAVIDPAFWTFLAVALPALILPLGIALWTGRNVRAVAVLSLVFWPAALALALRPERLRPGGTGRTGLKGPR